MVRALKTPSKNLRICCWVGMHVYGGGLCCVHAFGFLIMLFMHTAGLLCTVLKCLPSYCSVIVHDCLGAYVHTGGLFCTFICGVTCILLGCFARLLDERGYVHTAGYLICMFIWGLCAYYLVFMHIYLGVTCTFIVGVGGGGGK